MATYPLTQAPNWKLSGAGAGLLGASAPIQATYAQGASNGSQPALSNVLQADATQKFRIGSTVLFTDETYGEVEAIYLKGVASLQQYDACRIDTAQGTPVSVTRLITTNDATMAGPVAVALSNPNATQFGWFAIRGKVPVSSSGSCVINESIAASGTAGQVTDASDTLDTQGNIIGASCRTADGSPSGGTAAGYTDVQLSYPSCWEK